MKKNKFILFQMAFDGDYVKDSEHGTLEEAEETSADLGSKWYFYPFSIIVKGQTVVETGGNNYGKDENGDFYCILSNLLKGKRLTTVQKIFKRVSELPEAQNVDGTRFEDLLIQNI